MNFCDLSVTDEYFFPLSIEFDKELLSRAVDQLIAAVPFAFKGTRQIGLQSRPGSTDPWYEACRRQSDIGDDNDYIQLNPDLTGSYIDHVLASLPFRPFRARLMALEPKTCYAIHRDSTPRFHIAVTTTPHARFVFTERQRVYHIPDDGHIYFVDTREMHTAFNGGDTLRVHIVFGGPVLQRQVW